jgi:hypothetical protein
MNLRLLAQQFSKKGRQKQANVVRLPLIFSTLMLHKPSEPFAVSNFWSIIPLVERQVRSASSAQSGFDVVNGVACNKCVLLRIYNFSIHSYIIYCVAHEKITQKGLRN